MNFFPFHPGDYMLRTAHLDPIEDLAYRRLIDLYYVNEAPLSGTAEELSRVIRLRAHSAEVDAVLREFFSEEDGTWSHSHCDDVIDQYRAKAQQAAENGKRGGRPKKTQNEPKSNPEETQPVISANPEETGSQANQEPITNNQTQEDQHHSLNAGEPTAEDFSVVQPDATHAKNALVQPELETTPEPVDPKAPVEMTLDWMPDANLLKTYCLHYGVSTDQFTKDAIAPFTAHHETGGSLSTQAKWVSLLVKWVKNDQNRSSNVRPFVKRETQSRHTGFADRDYTAGLTQREDGTYAF